jgi:hypothetical protein
MYQVRRDGFFGALLPQRIAVVLTIAVGSSIGLQAPLDSAVESVTDLTYGSSQTVGRKHPATMAKAEI